MSSTTSASIYRASAHSLSYSSSASTPDTALLSSEVEVDSQGFVKSLRRVGGPTLCSLPVDSGSVSARYDERTGFYSKRFRIINEAERILRSHELSYKDIRALGRRSHINPELDPNPTVLILMDHQSVNHNWLLVSKEIHREIAARVPGISVEIMDERLNIPMRCYPIEENHSVYGKWERICRSILSHQEMNRTEWNGVSIWRYGTNPDPQLNRVTLIVCVDQSANGVFETSKRRVRGILRDYEERNVDIFFHRSDVVLYIQNLGVPENACSRTPKPGVSIGIANSSAGSSTLGGLVELRFPNSRKWSPYALTCFHCVFPSKAHCADILRKHGKRAEDALQKALWNPVRPRDNLTQILRVEHPSAIDLKRSIQDLDNTIREIRDETFKKCEVQANKIARGDPNGFLTPYEETFYKRACKDLNKREDTKAKFRRFLGENDLGKLFAGSGYYRAKVSPNRQVSWNEMKCVVDWALITVNERRLERDEDGTVTKNKPFSYIGEERGDFINAVSFDNFLKGERKVHKTGRSTQYTKSTISGKLQSYLLWHHQIPEFRDGHQEIVTHEYAICQSHNGAPFSEHGDSGAFVCDKQGQVLGLLWGGRPYEGITYLTNIREVFSDIKKVTGALEVRVAC